MHHHRVDVRCTGETYNPLSTYDNKKHLGVAKHSLDIFGIISSMASHNNLEKDRFILLSLFTYKTEEL
jgi:hypothetical protein